MFDFLFKLFSKERKIANTKDKLEKAISSENHDKALRLYERYIVMAYELNRIDDLANAFTSYEGIFEDNNVYFERFERDKLMRYVVLLEEHEKYEAAILVHTRLNNTDNLINLYSRLGNVGKLLQIMTASSLTKDLLNYGIERWLSYQSDFAQNVTWKAFLSKIYGSSPELLPDIAEVYECLELYQRAAELYSRMPKYDKAAECSEKLGDFSQALEYYLKTDNRSKISHCYEKLGNLEAAIEYCPENEHKVELCVETKDFAQAVKVAQKIGMRKENYEKVILNSANEFIELSVNLTYYKRALDVVVVVNMDKKERDKIVQKAREFFQEKLKHSYMSKEEGEEERIYREWAEIEEIGGNFIEAAVILEKNIRDYRSASRLFEREEMYGRAIDALKKLSFLTKDDLLRLAKLHEDGGNHLTAALIYEKLENYEKSCGLYEEIGDIDDAIRCCDKIGNVQKLISLLEKGGYHRKIIEFYMDKGGDDDLLKALKVAEEIGDIEKQNEINAILQPRVSENLNKAKQLLEDAKREVLNEYTLALGIDFGTTNSLAAIYNKKLGKPEIILSEKGESLIPSYFAVKPDNSEVVGDEAKKLLLYYPDRVIDRVKRSMGRNVSLKIGEDSYRPEQIAARIMSYIKLTAENYLRRKIIERFDSKMFSNKILLPKSNLSELTPMTEIKRAVITVPAYFNDSQKRATRDAGEIAGLNIMRLIHEPTAACLTFGMNQKKDMTVAVFDLGGGTFDISVIEVREGVFDVKAISGDNQLGGSDIDEILLLTALKQFEEDFGIALDKDRNILEIKRLRNACEGMKIALSSMENYSMNLNYFYNGKDFIMNFTRSQLEELAMPILKKLEQPCLRVIGDVSGKLDKLILVGNATLMPAVKKKAESIFKLQSARVVDAAEAVAVGASLQAANLSGDLDILLMDVVPFSLGVSALKEDKREHFIKHIERNTTIPTTKSAIYTTPEDNQNTIQIKIYQGESDNPKLNDFLGMFNLSGIPPARAGVPQINVTFGIDANCTLTVTAEDLGTGKKCSIQIKDATTLPFKEKEELTEFFKTISSLEELLSEANSIKISIEQNVSQCKDMLKHVDKAFSELNILFRNIQKNYRFYNATPEQSQKIGEIFIEKDVLLERYRFLKDNLNSIEHTYNRSKEPKIDFKNPKAQSELEKFLTQLRGLDSSIKRTLSELRRNVLEHVNGWLLLLKNIPINENTMSLPERAEYYYTHGSYAKFIECFSYMEKENFDFSSEQIEKWLDACSQSRDRNKYFEVLGKHSEKINLLRPDLEHLNEYLKNVSNSIVLISIYQEEQIGFGTGFAISENQIITNKHVVQGCSQNQIHLVTSNNKLRVTEIICDNRDDVALLAVESETPLPFLRLGKSQFVEPGESIIAIGFPYVENISHQENLYITKGTVSSIRPTTFCSERVFYLDAQIGRGMSGGPVINEYGEVIGVVTFTLKEVVTLESLHFAIPVQLIKNILSYKEI